MPFNIKSTISDYNTTLNSYIKNIHIDNSLSDYEKLNILSDILISLKLINKFLPLDILLVDSLYIFKKLLSDDTISTNIDVNNILVFLNDDDINILEPILHSFGVYIYHLLINKENTSINANLTKLCSNLADIFLNRSNEELDSYISISDNKTNFLNFLCKPEQLFARGFKSFVLYNVSENYNLKSSTDFSNNEYLEFKSSIKHTLLESTKDMLSEDLIKKSSKNILLNDLPENIKLAELKRYSKMEASYHLNEVDSLDCSMILIQDYINKNNCSFEVEDLLANEAEQDSLSDKNILNFKEDIQNLSIEDIYDMNLNLQEDINKLRTEISLLDEEIQYIEGEIVKGKRKKKDKSLLELLRFNFFLSQEYKNKIKMQKALEYADETYTPEYINYSELRDKEKQMNKIILSEAENTTKDKDTDKNKNKIENTYTVHIDNIQSSIARALGVSPSKLKEAIANLESNSNKKINRTTSWIKFKSKDIIPKNINKKSYKGLTTNTHITNIIENKIKGKKLTNIKSKNVTKNKEKHSTIETSYILSHNNNNLFDKLLEEATIALAKEKELSQKDHSEYEM